MNRWSKIFVFSIVNILIIVGSIGCIREEPKVNRDIDIEPIIPEKLAQLFLQGDYEKIYHQTSTEFKEHVSLKEFKDIAKQFNQNISSYEKTSELVLNDIVRIAWISDKSDKGLVVTFDDQQIIIGLQVQELIKHPEQDQMFSKTELSYPFNGEWFVGWGGTNTLVNYHYALESQRYAFDLLIQKDGRSYQGDKSKNESYYAFGQEILAPASGTVVKVVNHIPDNKPVGVMNEKDPAGNMVMIDHGNGEYSFLAHFKYQSILVKEGDWVEPGQVLGLCGNSGNSSEPHLHFDVLDKPDIFTGKSIRANLPDKNIIQGQTIRGSSSSSNKQ